MKTHELKTDSEVFNLSINDRKFYEIRYNDREFKIGDKLILKETIYNGQEMKDGSPLIYTDRELIVYVNSIIQGYGLKDGWVILNIDKTTNPPKSNLVSNDCCGILQKFGTLNE